jgi:hypothetical protein
MPSNEWYIEQAREKYANPSNDDVEVDDDAVISHGNDDGVWVQAWVWVDNPELEYDDE